MAPDIVTRPNYNLGADDTAQLGLASYTAYVYDRAGVEQKWQIPFTSLQWQRVIDGVSTASISLNGNAYGLYGHDQIRAIVDGTHAWANEIGIFRNNTKVWGGPVTAIACTPNSIEIAASDIGAWIYRRIVHQDRNFTQVDLAVIAKWIIEDAMSVDNVPGVIVEPTDTGVIGDRKVKKNQYLSAGDQIDELARTGLDWTVVDRTVIVGNFEIPATPLAYLTSAHFAGVPQTEEQGMSIGTHWYVLGGNTGDDGPTIVGEATGGDTAKYGVHERVVNESTIEDKRSARAAANTRRDALSEPPVIITGTDLAPTAPITVDQLIPGRIVSTLIESPREIRQESRIKSVDCNVSADNAEDLSITLEPVGTVGIEDLS